MLVYLLCVLCIVFWVWALQTLHSISTWGYWIIILEWLVFVDAIYEGPLRKYWDRMKRWAAEIGWRIMKAPSSRMLCECAIYKKRGHQIQRVRDAMAMSLTVFESL